MTDYTAKHDEGKLDLTLVPRQIIWDIAEVREYGNKKYGDPDNWKQVEPERYRAAAFRHFLAYLDEPDGVDRESGLTHLAHLACNIAFLCEMEFWARGDKIVNDLRKGITDTFNLVHQRLGGKELDETGGERCRGITYSIQSQKNGDVFLL